MMSHLLVVAVGLSCLVWGSLAQGVIENYTQLWIETMEENNQVFHTQSLRDCKGISFKDGSCPKLPSKNYPPNANLLTPEDIGVVAAIGDSITAGFGARAKSKIGILPIPDLINAVKEFRGVSWSIGGDEGSSEECATLPNILRNFNKDVKGASIGIDDHIGFNMAVSGAESGDILTQAKYLVGNLTEQLSETEFNEEWKLVTLWIGGNDLCRSCNDPKKFSADNYVKRIAKTLTYLKDNLPRTLVNVPQVLDVTGIAEMSGIICGLVELFACDCPRSSPEKTENLVVEYQTRLNDLYTAEYSSLFDDDDFSFVIQPFFLGVTVPYKAGKVDMDFFAPDCFHLSVKGHRGIAAALWNNMLAEPDKKEENWVPYGPTLECPNPEEPFIFTIKTRELLSSLPEFQSQFYANSENDQEDDASDQGDGKSRNLGRYFGTVIGSSAAAYLAVVLVVVTVGVVWHRRRQSRSKSENIPLITNI